MTSETIPGHQINPGEKKNESGLKLVENKDYSEPSPIIILSIDNDGKILLLEGKNLENIGIRKNEFIGKNIFNILPYENAFLARIKTIFIKEENTSLIEVNSRHFDVFYTYLRNANDEAAGILCNAKDITDEIRVKEELQNQKAYFSQLFDNSPEGIVILDKNDIIINVNKGFEDLFGYTLNEVKGKFINEIIVPDKLAEEATDLSDNVRSGETIKHETERKHKDGSIIQVSVLGYSINFSDNNKGVYGIYRDITNRKKYEEQIKKSLFEKEVLLKEVHHRVKNNLQIIGSLLNFQTKFIKDNDALEKFKISQNRIKSIALIHEKLYQTKNISRIEFSGYAKSLTQHIFDVFGTNTGKINTKINANNIFLSVDTAIPCGLIINELVTNSLKYAFPDEKSGEININLDYQNSKYILTIRDNGIGLGDKIDFNNKDTLGLQLVNTLIYQLNAEMSIDRSDGTSYCITFSNMNYENRI